MIDRRSPATRPTSARGRPGTRGPGRSGRRMMPNGVWGRTWYTLSCLVAGLALVASGLSYVLVRDVSSIGDSHAITSGASTGPQNILLMGLESRRDWNGNILPGSILAKLHSGNAQQVANGTGGSATDTPVPNPIAARGKKGPRVFLPPEVSVKVHPTLRPRPTAANLQGLHAGPRVAT